MEVGKLEEALQVCAHAIETHPKDDTLHRNRGVLLYRLSRPEEALEAFDNALEINAHVVDTWNNRGTVLWKTQSDLPGALEAFDKALEINPNFKAARDARIGVLADIEAQKPKGFLSRIFGG